MACYMLFSWIAFEEFLINEPEIITLHIQMHLHIIFSVYRNAPVPVAVQTVKAH